MKTLNEIINCLNEGFDYCDCGREHAFARYLDNKVEVLAYIYPRGDAEVEVYNLVHDERLYTNIENLIKSSLLEWSEFEKSLVSDEDEYQRNGFANEADYIRWRYGA